MCLPSPNHDLKILPLFLKTSFDKAGKEGQWIQKWEEWREGDARIDLKKWKQAVLVIKKYDAMSYSDIDGEPTFIERVVEAICKSVEPDVKFNVPDNRSLKNVCEA